MTPNEPPAACDTELAHAARAAARALPGATLRRAAEPGGATSGLLRWLTGNSPIGRGERLILAELLGGELCSAGRPTTKHKEREAYRALIDDAHAKKRAMVRDGVNSYDAHDAVAQWAAADPRGRGNTWKTIASAMTRKRGRL